MTKPRKPKPAPFDMADPTVRWFIGCDQSLHDYLVPVAKRAEWDAWTQLDEDNTLSWIAPEWAIPFDGGPWAITFTLPTLPQ